MAYTYITSLSAGLITLDSCVCKKGRLTCGPLITGDSGIALNFQGIMNRPTQCREATEMQRV